LAAGPSHVASAHAAGAHLASAHLASAHAAGPTEAGPFTADGQSTAASQSTYPAGTTDPSSTGSGPYDGPSAAGPYDATGLGSSTTGPVESSADPTAHDSSWTTEGPDRDQGPLEAVPGDADVPERPTHLHETADTPVVVVPMGFRATLPDLPPSLPVETAVPQASISAFQRMTGVDLGFVPMVRSPEVAQAAAQLGARAYTTRGTVHLPPEAGPADRADNEALIAHELAHVAQQRALGSRASEQGVHGGRLEAQALAAERAARGEQVTPPSIPAGLTSGLSWTPETGFVSGNGNGGNGGDSGNGSQEAAQPTPPAFSYDEPIQRAPFDGGGGDVWRSTDEVIEHTPAVIPPEPREYDVHDWSTVELTAAVQRIESHLSTLDNEVAHPATAVSEATVANIVSRHVQGRYVALNDHNDLDRLATRIYDRLRNQLRAELLVDRERGGLLTDFD
jgi:hypothetical protein